MERVSKDVLHGAILPFLEMRDLRSLRTVSTRTYAFLSRPRQRERLFDSRRYVCAYDGCSNRAFLYNTVDPFIDYAEAAVLPRTVYLLAHWVSSMCLFPLYSIPFYRIIYLLVWQEFVAPDVLAMAEACKSYISVERLICSFTNTQPMNLCTCTDSMGDHADQQAVECTHIGWCIRTKEGGCIHCLFATTRIKSEISTLPYSFYVYTVMYLLLPGIAFVLVLPMLILVGLLCVLFGIPTIILFLFLL